MLMNDGISVKETKQIVHKENPTYLWNETKSYGVNHPNLAEGYYSD
jgi:hypothetical protein